MKDMTADATSDDARLTRYLILGIGLVVVIFMGFLAYRGQQPETPALPNEVTTISQNVLEGQYGLRVNLVAVTAAGGLVDLRLRIVDGEKAKSFLQDPNRFPSLWIADGDVSLVIPEEDRTQEIKFENDGNLFLMFPNVQGIVRPGTPVTVRFGDTQVEPISAR